MGRNNLAVSRRRDQRLYGLLDVHPCSNDQLVEWDIFPTPKKARERTLAGRRKGQIPYVYLVQDIDGYDVKLYSRFPVNQPEHEYKVTQAIIAYSRDPAFQVEETEGEEKPRLRVRRGHSVDHRRSDAELEFGGTVERLEVDNGTMSYRRLIGRIAEYDGCDDAAYWLMSSEARVEGIARLLPPHHMAATYARAIGTFRGPIWTRGTNVNPDSQPYPGPEGGPDRSIE